MSLRSCKPSFEYLNDPERTQSISSVVRRKKTLVDMVAINFELTTNYDRHYWPDEELKSISREILDSNQVHMKKRLKLDSLSFLA